MRFDKKIAPRVLEVSPRLFDVDIAGVDEPAFNLSVGVAATGTKQEKEIAYGLFTGRPARG